MNILYVWGALSLVATHTALVQLRPLPICFLFVADSSLETADIWQRWFEDAEVWTETVFKYEHDRPAKGLLDVAVYRTFWDSDDSFIILRPSFAENPFSQKGLVDEIYKGTSGDSTLAKMIRVTLQDALDIYPSAGHLIIVPPDAIPMKSFNYIWGHVTTERASHPEKLAGAGSNEFHMPWASLTRPHALELVRDDKWTLGEENSAYKREQSSEDVQSQSSGKAEQRSFEFLRMSDTNVFNKRVWEVPDGKISSTIGSVESEARRLLDHEYRVLTEVHGGLLRYLSEHIDVWMARGISNNTVVYPADVGDQSYYSSWVQIGANVTAMQSFHKFLGTRPSMVNSVSQEDRRSVFNYTKSLLLLKAADPSESVWDIQPEMPLADPNWWRRSFDAS